MREPIRFVMVPDESAEHTGQIRNSSSSCVSNTRYLGSSNGSLKYIFCIPRLEITHVKYSNSKRQIFTSWVRPLIHSACPHNPCPPLSWPQ